jgi:prevent-host-death family protein
MINIAAREARANFGELMDTVQREPVSIEKHGRAVAVVISAVEYESIKTELLKARIKTGCEQLERGEFSQLSVLEILEEAKNIHAKIQTIPAS